MAFQVSPGVLTREIDLSAVIPTLPTTEGALAGVFRWGPVEKVTTLGSEQDLINQFGKPTNFNAETWFSAANFLAYSNVLHVVRGADVVNATGNACHSAVANTAAISGNAFTFNVKNHDDYDVKSEDFTAQGPDVKYIAKYPGTMGNTLKVSVCDSANAYRSTINVVGNSSVNDAIAASFLSLASGANTISVKVTAADITNAVAAANLAATILTTFVNNAITLGDVLDVGNTTTGKFQAKVVSISAISRNTTAGFANLTIRLAQKVFLKSTWTANTVQRNWEYFANVSRAPGQSQYFKNLAATGQANASANDELHVVVVDQRGDFSGVPGQTLEIFEALSRATNAKTLDGATNYYATVINEGSKYVWWANDRANALSETSTVLVNSTNDVPLTLSFVRGTNGDLEEDVSASVLLDALDLFRDDQIPISLVLAGKAHGAEGTQIANYIIDNICLTRKDCMVFISPEKADVVGASAFSNEADSMIEFRNNLISSSYGFLDSGYKYQYDRYNDIFRWVPLNGDIAGLVARTDRDRDPWFSPAGIVRGVIKNSVKLAFNPNQTNRDKIYPNDINPVVTFPGEGTLLFGDKTLQGFASAFDRINVRRLFIVLEKAIARFARLQLFELNDEFTRAQFVSVVEPYLRDVQGRRGIYAFRVVCDETNNTPVVIDSNRFVGDIYIQPAKSINFILLTFIATRTGVDFDEIINPSRQ